MKTKFWLEHLIANENKTLDLSDDGYRITNEERFKIATSIRSFQLGECSEGRSLKHYADLVNDPDYSHAIRLLIKEENRHSAYLASFMKDQGIPKAQKTWTATSFKFLKNLAGLELRLRVLITAEIVALSYYGTLGTLTGSPKLARICNQMKIEEEMHVEFQMHHIQLMSFKQGRLLNWFGNLAHGIFAGATAYAVWLEHKSVLRTQFNSFTYIARVVTDYQKILSEGRRSVMAEQSSAPPLVESF
ncbi:MAG: ferritin-like domain-containing protein [Proteobacteria bacterium]|nr:MAG: ferritin-like domain-containing protein [Pseudomonadota bacterium]